MKEPELTTPWDEWENWQDHDSDSFIYQVQSSRTGQQSGLGNGLKTINKYIYGTQRGMFYLLGGDSGSGKSTITDYMFVLNTWLNAKRKGTPIRIYYCSFEVSKAQKIARWVSYYIYQTTGQSMPSMYILGKIEGKLPDDKDMELIKKAYRMVTKMLNDIIIIDMPMTPSDVYETLLTVYYEKQGKLTRRAVSAADAKKGKKGEILKYVPNNANAMCVLIIDHLALLEPEPGLTIKATMDKMSRNAIKLRNICQTTLVFIQQFSTDLLHHKRDQINKLQSSKKASAIIPNRLDFGDTKSIYRDASVVIGLVKPYAFDIDSFLGVNTTPVSSGGLGSYLTVMYLMKNRDGSDMKTIPVFVNPVAGSVDDIPIENDNALASYYARARMVDQIVHTYTPKD